MVTVGQHEGSRVTTETMQAELVVRASCGMHGQDAGSSRPAALDGAIEKHTPTRPENRSGPDAANLRGHAAPSALITAREIATDAALQPKADDKGGYTLRRRSDGEVTLEVPAGSALPPGGLLLTWPGRGAPGLTRVNGVTAAWRDGMLRITRLPARVEIGTKR